MTDDSFINNELDKFATYYNLKHTIRWAKNRTGDVTESVAEHVYGMHVLCSYFLPLVDPDRKLDSYLVQTIITWHDMAEAIVSDMTTKSKTAEHKANEKAAEVSIIKNATPHLHDQLAYIYESYDERTTPEAQFVKALDKIEPMFHLSFLIRKHFDINAHFSLQWEADEYREHRDHYLSPFPLIKRFDDILYEETKEYYQAA